MHYKYKTHGTCAQLIEFDLNKDIVTNIQFLGGCPGNLKAISKLLDGSKAEDIYEKLKGNTCGVRQTSCADQLAIAVKEALDKQKLE